MPPKGGARRAARSAALTKGFLGSLCCCSAVKGSRGPPGDLSTVRKNMTIAEVRKEFKHQNNVEKAIEDLENLTKRIVRLHAASLD